ncbi:hypothetical protein SAMN06265365_14826 [Tistlia consotensis]|uniref:Uncharacterized protein n=2 Tax=Tistlia TaxID=1321364 RepID=A0A1Y6CQR5_9PROT|nr:hypothetical protein SAMN05428998_14827 [Tistlia consotensis USBA 355]SNS31528.1 hypothetical protein SAMN06265365_14826 [Tistlia consotensis]
MKKAEAESHIRSLCHDWRRETGQDHVPAGELSPAQFITWLRQRYPQVLRFRTSLSIDYDVEFWFDQEFKLSWRR